MDLGPFKIGDTISDTLTQTISYATLQQHYQKSTERYLARTRAENKARAAGHSTADIAMAGEAAARATENNQAQQAQQAQQSKVAEVARSLAVEAQTEAPQEQELIKYFSDKSTEPAELSELLNC